MTTPSQTENPRTLSDLMLDYLNLLGVEYLFGVPGGHIGGLYEALDRSAQHGGIKPILCRHETGAAFMAAGYARETGKLGVCCGTTSPGTTNLITGASAADADQDPILVLSGQTALPMFGRGAFQESSPDVLDTSAMMKECCTYSSLVTHPRQFEGKLLSALLAALKPPHGAVHLSVPVDLYRAPWANNMAYPNVPQLLQNSHALMDTAAVERLWQAIVKTREAGKKVVLFIGHSCQGATDTIMQLAERLDADIITTQAGKNWVNAYHPRVKGVFGFAGHHSAREALENPEVDLIIAAGSRLGQWGTSTFDKAVLNDKLVHIHPHPFYFQRSLAAQIQVHGEVQAVFSTLLDKLASNDLPTNTATAVAETAKGEHPPHIELNQSYEGLETETLMHPQCLMQRMMRDLPDDTRLYIDVGTCLAWTIHYFFNREPERFQLSVDTASMGWGIGASVGAAMGNCNAPVVCLAGDGAWLLSGQEMSLAVAEKLPMLFIVLNNGDYTMITQNQAQKSPIKLDFPITPATDFSLIAQGLGGYGHIINNAADWDALDIAEILSRDAPTVLDVRVDPQVLAPLGMF